MIEPQTLVKGRTAIIIVYMEYIILIGDYVEEIGKLKSFLLYEFEIKDLGNLKYFLGMKIARSKMRIIVSKRKYVLDLLKKTGMLVCKLADTPMNYTTKLGIVKRSALVDKGRYQRLVEKLIYLSYTRLDITFLVNIVSQFMNNPTEEHMKAAYRILSYLKMNPRKGLYFKRTQKRNIEFFSNADWVGSIIDQRSSSRYSPMFGRIWFFGEARNNLCSSKQCRSKI